MEGHVVPGILTVITRAQCLSLLPVANLLQVDCLSKLLSHIFSSDKIQVEPSYCIQLSLQEEVKTFIIKVHKSYTRCWSKNYPSIKWIGWLPGLYQKVWEDWITDCQLLIGLQKFVCSNWELNQWFTLEVRCEALRWQQIPSEYCLLALLWCAV